MEELLPLPSSEFPTGALVKLVLHQAFRQWRFWLATGSLTKPHYFLKVLPATP